MKFCLVGTGRCGTRLLRSMLNAHPDLFVFNETHWIANLHECFGTAEAPVDDMLDIVVRTRHVDGSKTTEFDRQAFGDAMKPPSNLTPAALSDAIGRFFAGQSEKSIWADKTPDYGYMAATLQLHWPDCKVIHLIRDGAAVVNSMKHHPGYQALVALGRQNWCSLSLDFEGFSKDTSGQRTEEFVELWYRRLTRIRNESLRLKPGSYLEVRHEDVLASPADTLDEIAHFVGLRNDETWSQAAHSLINKAKSSKPRPINALNHFGKKHLQLMHELGYSTELPGGQRC